MRTGRAEAVVPELHGVMTDALGGSAAIGGADVVLCTCVGAGAESIAKHAFPAVLIDETAQSTEPSCLVPLTRGVRQLVLIGDHKQLRPTVVCDAAADGGLMRSLFERWLRAGVAPQLLDTQYRMHPSLAAFPSAQFYGGLLRSGTDAASRPQPRGFTWPSAAASVALVLSISAEEGADGASKRNPGEAATVVSIARSLLSAGEIGAPQLGIITPYASQVRAMPREAPERQCRRRSPGPTRLTAMRVSLAHRAWARAPSATTPPILSATHSATTLLLTLLLLCYELCCELCCTDTYTSDRRARGRLGR